VAVGDGVGVEVSVGVGSASGVIVPGWNGNGDIACGRMQRVEHDGGYAHQDKRDLLLAALGDECLDGLSIGEGRLDRRADCEVDVHGAIGTVRPPEVGEFAAGQDLGEGGIGGSPERIGLARFADGACSQSEEHEPEEEDGQEPNCSLPDGVAIASAGAEAERPEDHPGGEHNGGEVGGEE